MNLDIERAKKYFYNKDYKSACEIFLKYKKFYESGMCFLFMNDIKNAKKYWQMDKENKFASSWGLNVLEFIKLKMLKPPTYLQIRAFYEMYIELFIENSMIDYAQNLINMYPTLSKYNSETYKFVCRALYAKEYYDLALDFAKKTEEEYNFDPEALYISADINFMRKNYAKSFDEIRKILDVIPNYYPARKLKETLLKTI